MTSGGNNFIDFSTSGCVNLSQWGLHPPLRWVCIKVWPWALPDQNNCIFVDTSCTPCADVADSDRLLLNILVLWNQWCQYNRDV